MKRPLATGNMPHRAHGFSLIEVMVAMTIFSVGVLGLLGMYGRTVTNYSDAKYRTDAALLAEALLSRVWVDRANIANYAYTGTGANTTLQPWLNEVTTALPNGNAVVTVNGTATTGSTVEVKLSWQPPDAAAQGQTHTHIEIATIQNP